MDELIVSLCLICHWTYPEACRFVNETPIKKVRAFVKELQYQKAMEDYRVASNAALIIATWANAQKKGNHYQVKDFIGQPPQRADTPDRLKAAIEKANIKLPEDK